MDFAPTGDAVFFRRKKMTNKIFFIIAFTVMMIAAGTISARVGIGLEAGLYTRVSDLDKVRLVESFSIDKHQSDGSCPLSYRKANGEIYWEGIGKIVPQNNGRLRVCIGSGNASTYDLEILDNGISFKFYDLIWKKAR
jgi:hypothetical protein